MEILKKLGIEYNDIEIYKQAFTHTSYANEENCISYERLEFLGDAVLELVMSEYLYNTTNYPEGKMTKLRSNYVCEKALYEYACILGINEEISLGKGEKAKDGKYNRAIVSDAFEAFIGAIFVDKGIEEVKRFMHEHIMPLIENDSIDFIEDYKSVLQEMVQTGRKTLEYVVTGESGPAHAKEFTVIVKIDEILYGTGKANSKKEAEQVAAKEALKKSRNGEKL